MARAPVLPVGTVVIVIIGNSPSPQQTQSDPTRGWFLRALRSVPPMTWVARADSPSPTLCRSGASGGCPPQ
jgi:hypothetical protein